MNVCMRRLVLVLLILPVGFTFAQEASKESLKDKLEQAREAEIVSVKQRINELNSAIRGKSRSTAIKMRTEIKLLQRKLASIQDRDYVFHVALTPPFKKNRFGRINDTPKVLQVVDEDEAIVEIMLSLDPNRPPYKFVLWMKGVPTTDVADSMLWPETRDYYFKVTGTKTYQTLAGQKTLPLLEAFTETVSDTKPPKKATPVRRRSRVRSGYGWSG